MILLFTIALLVLSTHCWTPPATCKGSLNKNPIFDVPPTLVKAVPNGKLFRTGTPDNPLDIVHVYGSAYDMGYAQGQLLKDEINEFFTEFYQYLDVTIEPYLKDLPEWLQHIIEKDGIEAGLEFTLLATKAFTPDHFYQEAQGLGDAIGQSQDAVMRLNLFPELIKASCSMMGAWGQATNGGLMQLRALDWGTNNPIRLHPAVVVYHPEQGHPFAILTFKGFFGALTGYSTNVAVCEKYWYKYNNASTRFGVPWMFLLRDILQFDETIDDGFKRILSNERTCSIFVGLGGHESGEFRVVEYSHMDVREFNDSTPFPGYAPTPKEHPLMKDIVYVDKHTQPSSDPCMADILKAQYGSISTESIWQLTSVFQTGDFHLAISDFKANKFSVAVATQTGKWPNPDRKPAYDRQLITLDMESAFSEPSP